MPAGHAPGRYRSTILARSADGPIAGAWPLLAKKFAAGSGNRLSVFRPSTALGPDIAAAPAVHHRSGAAINSMEISRAGRTRSHRRRRPSGMYTLARSEEFHGLTRACRSTPPRPFVCCENILRGPGVQTPGSDSSLTRSGQPF